MAMAMAPGRFANIVTNGHAVAAALGDDALEHRRLGDRPAQVERDEQQREGEQERDAPSPRRDLLGGKHRREDDEDGGGEDRADGGAELGDRGVERALDGAGVLGGEEDRAAPLAAERQALGDAQQDQQRGAEPARLRVGGQEADEPGRDAHDADRPQQGGPPAEAVAHVAEDHGADRSHDERERDRQERRAGRAELRRAGRRTAARRRTPRSRRRRRSRRTRARFPPSTPTRRGGRGRIREPERIGCGCGHGCQSWHESRNPVAVLRIPPCAATVDSMHSIDPAITGEHSEEQDPARAGSPVEPSGSGPSQPQ